MLGRNRHKRNFSEGFFIHFVGVMTMASIWFVALIVAMLFIVDAIPGIPDWDDLPWTKFLAIFALWGIIIARQGICHGYDVGYRVGYGAATQDSIT